MDPNRRARRDRLLAFEVELTVAACEEGLEREWGRVLLTPSLPEVWVANLVVLEAEGMPAAAVAELADRELGGRGIRHRYVLVSGEDDGRRLAAETAAELPGWEVERNEYMEHVPGTGDRRAPAAA